MRNVLNVLFILGGILLLQNSMTIFASSGATSTSSTGVVVREENGVKYLSTDIVQDSTAAAEASIAANKDNQEKSLSLSQFLGGEITPPAGFFTDLTTLYNKLIQVVLTISALLTFFYLIWGGFQWITSGGDKGKTEKARNTIFSAIIGLILVASSYAILLLVLNFLGYDDLNDVLQQANVSIDESSTKLNK